jgi:hypothetical protein
MRSRRFTVARLQIDGVDVALRYGDLVVVAHETATTLDWECVAVPRERNPLDQGAYRIDVVTLEGRVLGGDAVLVRSIEGTHVLRGAGDLHGIAESDLGD